MSPSSQVVEGETIDKKSRRSRRAPRNLKDYDSSNAENSDEASAGMTQQIETQNRPVTEVGFEQLDDEEENIRKNTSSLFGKTRDGSPPLFEFQPPEKTQYAQMDEEEENEAGIIL